MADYAKAPNSCELDKSLTRGWQLQVKPKGLAETEWKFVLGLTSFNVNIEKQTVDATDLNSDGWGSQKGVGRTMAMNGTVQYSTMADGSILHPVTRMLQLMGEEIGVHEQVDARAWREDVDEGWEGTFNVTFTENTGDANSIRNANLVLNSNCAPTRIHSVLEGADKEESIEVTDAELANLIAGKPEGAPVAPVETQPAG